MDQLTPVAVTVNYNAGEAFERCVASLAEARDRGSLSGFIVVDNASTDGSYDAPAIERAGGSAVQSPFNVGFARAVNHGIELAGDVDIVLLNPDAILDPASIQPMLEELGRGKVAAVGAGVSRENGEYQPSAFPEPTLGWAAAHLLDLARRPKLRLVASRFASLSAANAPYLADEPGEARDVDWVVGSCMLLSREAVKDIGGLDERFFLYFEEIDWCRRARDAGWRIRFVPVPGVVHEIGRSASSAPLFATRAHYASMVGYFDKHHGAAGRIAVQAMAFTMLPVQVIERRMSIGTLRAALSGVRAGTRG